MSGVYLVVVGDGEFLDVLRVRPSVNLDGGRLGEVIPVVEVVNVVRHSQAAARQVL